MSLPDLQPPGEPEALADDTALSRLAVEVTSSLRLAEVLDMVTSGLVRSLGADAAYLWLESATPGGPGGAAELLDLRPSTLRSRMARHRLRRSE